MQNTSWQTFLDICGHREVATIGIHGDSRNGIPEVWRHDGKLLTMTVLSDDHYETVNESRQLPGLTTAMIEAVLSRRFEVGETPLIRGFRQSLCQSHRWRVL